MTPSSHMAVGASASSSAGFSSTTRPKFAAQAPDRRQRPQERTNGQRRPIAGWARAFLREGL